MSRRNCPTILRLAATASGRGALVVGLIALGKWQFQFPQGSEWAVVSGFLLTPRHRRHRPCNHASSSRRRVNNKSAGLISDLFSEERPQLKNGGRTTTTTRALASFQLPASSSSLQHHPLNNQRRRRYPSKRAQLHWIARSIEKLPEDAARSNVGEPMTSTTSQTVRDSEESSKSYHRFLQREPIVVAIRKLADAQNRGTVLEVGRQFESELLELVLKDCYRVRDLTARSLAITGLSHLALNVSHSILARDERLLPSLETQDKICACLRTQARIHLLEDFVSRLRRHVAASSPPREGSGATISTKAFNIYLAALCDCVTRKTTKAIKQDNSTSRAAILQKARNQLRLFGANNTTDAVSYATLMQTAAAVGNQTLTNELWEDMRTHSIEPSIIAYNARLRAVTRSKSIARDEEILAIYEEIINDSSVQPDRFTLDLILLPLVERGRADKIASLLDAFIVSSGTSDSILSEAFNAFLLTLVKGGEVSAAHAIFDRYIRPSLSRVMVGDAGAMHIVQPTVRHVNTLLEGYKALAQRPVLNSTSCSVQSESGGHEPLQQVRSRQRQYLSANESEAAYENGWGLYQLMLESPRLAPDAYTVSSMMGLCKDAGQLASLLRQAAEDFGMHLSSTLLRAAITGFGGLGDASSAVWMFANFPCKLHTPRIWNVLLGAMCKSIQVNENNTPIVLDVSRSNAARSLSSRRAETYAAEVVDCVDGLPCHDAVDVILSLMRGDSDVGLGSLKFPRPNSQSYCIVAAAMQHGPYATAENAMALFRNATLAGIRADGRFVNALFRCFGSDVEAALDAWKGEIREACLAHEHRTRSAAPSIHRRAGKNLIAAYHGLAYVCGRAYRPDVAVRIAYAMNREGIEPNEDAINCYWAGKRRHEAELKRDSGSTMNTGIAARLERMRAQQYESILYVECHKFDKDDRRRLGQRRVRIIV